MSHLFPREPILMDDEGMAEYSTIRVNDRDLCYWRTGSGRQPLLILHTLRTQIEYTERVVPLLAERFRIIVPDLPGHGRSSKDLSRAYDATLFVETVAALVEELDLSDLSVLGESIGGSIALCLAADMPQRLSRVFAVNPHDSTGSFIGGPLGSAVSLLGRFTSIPFKLEFPALLRLICLAGVANNDNLTSEFVGKLISVPNEDPRFPAVMRSMMQHAHSWSRLADEKYPRIPASMPTRVIYGDHDWSPSWAVEQNKRRLPEHVRFTTLAETGHFSFLDNPSGSADIVNAAVGA